MWRMRGIVAAAVTVITSAAGVTFGVRGATATVVPASFDLPVFRVQVPAGGGATVDLPAAHDALHRVDADPSAWHGVLPGFGGTMMYSHGELVYEDFIDDAWGSDNGQNTARLAALNTLDGVAPQFYRLDPAYQYLPGEFGIPTGPLVTGTNYGEDPYEPQADLTQVRLATDHERNLWLLARTTVMDDHHPGTALLVLLDTRPGTSEHTIPFNSGLTTRRADVAVFLHGSYGAWVDLADPSIVHVLPAGSVATDPAGYTNAVEARLPAGLLGNSIHRVGVAVAAGLADSHGTALASLPVSPNVANVAFRLHEPARDYFDENQALDLHTGTMDAFFVTADLDRMAAGANQRYVPGPGYHERVIAEQRAISTESGMNTIYQDYGVYLPSDYRAGHPTATQYWFHFRGGDTNVAAAVVPGVFWDMGEAEHSIVITPGGRGQALWYVGASQLDVLDVWRDSHRMFSIDPNRTYIAGHSMGGWASYLLPIEHPDWFAAAFPASGPPTQGAFTGAPGCTASTPDSDGACWQDANGGNAQKEYTAPLLGNLRGVPYAIYQGTNDELVPPPGVIEQALDLRKLGYRYQLFLFPGQEHYGPPVVDQWTAGAEYEHEFVRDPNPPEVIYTRSMVFEHELDTVNAEGATLSFPLDHAYWMSGLTATDATSGVATVDAHSLAIPDPTETPTVQAGGPATLTQAYPYVMQGQGWKPGPAPATTNRFTAKLTGAAAVTFDTARMRLDPHETITGTVTTDDPLALTLTGDWAGASSVTIDDTPATVTRTGNRLKIDVPAGTHTVRIG